MKTNSTGHIVLLSSYLHVPGGYEKAVVGLANLFARKGYTVTLFILDQTPEIFYPLDKKVRVLQKHFTFGITQDGNTFTRKATMVKDILKLRRELKYLKPDFIIGSEYVFAIASILAGARRYAKVFSWEHHHYGASRLNFFWKQLMRRTYPLLNAVVTLNEDERRYYNKITRRAKVIPNFVEPQQPIPNNEQEKYILTVTRFNHIKGFDLLLDVAEKVFANDASIKWKVIGYGEQKEELLQFISRKKFNQRFIFIPATENDITSWYQGADFFVLTSRNECFPLTLLEAQSCGLPCIAFDCETGPRHIIRHEKNGLLVEKENTTKMAEAIIELWKNNSEKARMSAFALDSVRQFFPDPVFERWKDLFQEGYS